MGNCPIKRKTLNAIFFSTLWKIWRARNEKIFKKLSVVPTKTVDLIIAQTYDWCRCGGNGCGSSVEWNCSPFIHLSM